MILVRSGTVPLFDSETTYHLAVHRDLAAFCAWFIDGLNIPRCGLASTKTMSLEAKVGRSVKRTLVDLAVADRRLAWRATSRFQGITVFCDLLRFLVLESLTVGHLTTRTTLFTPQSPRATAAATSIWPVSANKCSLRSGATIERAVALFQGTLVALKRFLRIVLVAIVFGGAGA